MILLLLLESASGSGQSAWSLVIDGRVTEGMQRLDRAIVTVNKNGAFDKKTRTASNGKFSLVLQPNNDYLIEVSKPGYVSKTIQVFTKGVADEKVGKGFPAFPIEVGLFKEMKELDTKILEKPIAKIMYYEKEDNFNYDKAYVRQVQSKLDKLTREAEKLSIQKEAEAARAEAQAQASAAALAEAQAAAKAKAAAEAKKKSEDDAATRAKAAADADATAKAKVAAEVAAKVKAAAEAKRKAEQEAAAKAKSAADAKAIADAEAKKKADEEAAEKATKEAEKKKINDAYDAAIGSGDKHLKSQKYKEAIMAYQEAKAIKPKESYPQNKIEEIDALSAADEAKRKEMENRNAEIERKYKSAVANGDMSMKFKKYGEAKSFYKEAAGIKPTESYPKDKLREIEEIEKAAKAAELAGADKKYYDAISSADLSLESRNYGEAKKKYEEALNLRPTETYPKSKIVELVDLLAAQTRVKSEEAQNAKLRDESYRAVIVKADDALATRKFSEARKSYVEASGIKPDEAYPKNKIAAIDKRMEDARLAKDIASRAEADAKRKADAAKAEALRKLRAEREASKLAAIAKAKADKYKNEMDASERARATRQMHQEAHKGLTDEERHRYLGELALEYPPGLTEETYLDGNKKVTMRIVVAEGHATTFKKVLQPWGQIFYFKNGINTTKYLWESESDPD